MWLRWRPAPRPCFNPALLAACSEYCQFLQDANGVIEHDGKPHQVEFSILCSDIPGMFNLGGDLDLFTTHIKTKSVGP